MKIYTVHEPRKLTGEPAHDAERFVFVRDGFHFWAFVLAPLWMIWRRLWLVLLGYIVLVVALQIGLTLLGASAPAKFAVGFLVSLLVGFEAATLRRWTLRKRRQVGVVVARDLEDAERRFFDTWIARDALPAYPAVAAPMSAAPGASTTRAPSDVIGLFPEPTPNR